MRSAVLIHLSRCVLALQRKAAWGSTQSDVNYTENDTHQVQEGILLQIAENLGRNMRASQDGSNATRRASVIKRHHSRDSVTGGALNRALMELQAPKEEEVHPCGRQTWYT